jgi:hypothetical protein
MNFPIFGEGGGKVSNVCRIGKLTAKKPAFIYFASLILIGTATVKILSLQLAHHAINPFASPNQVFSFISQGYFLLSAAFLEYALALIILFTGNITVNYLLVGWFSALCFAYRFAVTTYGVKSCACMGVWTGSFQAVSDRASTIALIALSGITVIGIASRFRFITNIIRQKHSATGKGWITPLSRRSRNFALFSTLAFVPLCSAKSYVAIELEVTQTNFYSFRQTNGMAGHSSKTSSWISHCIVGLDYWSIESEFARGSIDKYYYDGTNVYHTMYAKKGFVAQPLDPRAEQLIQKLPFKLKPLPSVEDLPSLPRNLTVTPGGHPLDNMGANLPWFALCSGGYLRSPGRLLPLAGAEIRQFPGSFGFTDRTECFEDSLGLPKTSELLTSVKLLAAAPFHESLFRDLQGRENYNVMAQTVSVPTGLLISRYEVISSTNINDWHIPTRFKYEQFDFSTNSPRQNTLSLQGLVTSIKPSEAPNPIVTTNNVYSVVDYRFRDEKKVVDEIHYSLRNRFIPPVTDASLRKNFSARIAIAPIDPVITSKRGIYGLFIALLCIPFVISAWNYIKQRKDKKAK